MEQETKPVEVKKKKKGKDRRNIKEVHQCFYCDGLARGLDSFKAIFKGYRPIFAGGPKMKFEEEVTLCRACALKAGYKVKDKTAEAIHA